MEQRNEAKVSFLRSIARGPPGTRALIALLFSLVPSALFTFILGVILLTILAHAVGAGSFASAFMTPFALLVFGIVGNPVSIIPVLSSLAGAIMGLWIRKKEEDKETTKRGTLAAVLGVAGLIVYAYLLFLSFGLGS